MKKIILKVVAILCFVLTTHLQSQTYTINAVGSVQCNGATGIEQSYICSYDLLTEPVVLGSFTDTNAPGMEISSMALTLYAMCNGDFEVFINDVSVGTGTTTGTECLCRSIDANLNMVKEITVALTPEIIGAYVTGGVNTLAVSSSNSSGGAQCFYGAEVTVGTGTLHVENTVYETIKVVPNPMSNMFTVKGLKQVTPFKIYNVLGVEVLKGALPVQGKVQVGHLSNGIYYLKLEKKGRIIKFLKE